MTGTVLKLESVASSLASRKRWSLNFPWARSVEDSPRQRDQPGTECAHALYLKAWPGASVCVSVWCLGSWEKCQATQFTAVPSVNLVLLSLEGGHLILLCCVLLLGLWQGWGCWGGVEGWRCLFIYSLYPRPLMGIPSLFEGVFVCGRNVINCLVVIYWFLRLGD